MTSARRHMFRSKQMRSECVPIRSASESAPFLESLVHTLSVSATPCPSAVGGHTATAALHRPQNGKNLLRKGIPCNQSHKTRRARRHPVTTHKASLTRQTNLEMTSTTMRTLMIGLNLPSISVVCCPCTKIYKKRQLSARLQLNEPSISPTNIHSTKHVVKRGRVQIFRCVG